jgi:ABC-type branched-subunit amino acid transport system substrate-binding protein
MQKQDQWILNPEMISISGFGTHKKGYSLARNRFFQVFVLLLGLTLAACGPAAATSNTPIGSLWDVTVLKGKVDWAAASNLAQEQHTGFTLANKTAKFDEVIFSEGNRQDDVQAAVRAMVEGRTETPKSDPVLGMLGATSNQATARAASLANFFNVPMLIPAASGDNLLPANNLWAFQLSPPNSAYATYLLGSVMTKQTLRADFSDVTPTVRIAILYEQNTYGENAAVATATAAMQQELEISTYDKFSAENPDPARLRILVNQVLDEGAQVVFIISSDPLVAQDMVFTFNSLVDAQSMPLLVGIAGGFTSQDFVNSAQSKNVYVLRQQFGTVDCPAEINSLSAAQNYAALKLMEYAVQEASKVKIEKPVLSLSKVDAMAASREKVRDALKAASVNLPCLGQVAFDNTGQNKFPQFEIVMTSNGETRIISPAEFITAVKQKIGSGG